MPEAEPDALVVAILHQQPLQKLLRSGVDTTVRDQAGLTPLHHAVLAGNVDAVEALLEHACKRTRPLRKPGGDPSKNIGSPWHLVTAPGPPPSRPSPLHLAAERNENLLRLILGHSSLTSVRASFLGITISSRPQPELLQLRDARGWSLLHYAVSRANLATLRLLLPHMGGNPADSSSSGSSRSSSAGGAAHYTVSTNGDVNAPDAFGRNALHQAALLGHGECCRLLLKAGADQAAMSAPPEGALPLHLAASGNHTTAVEVLFRHAIAQHGFRSAQSVLLRPNAAGLTALHVAALQGAVDAARRLLHLVFPFDTRGPLGRTALHLAAMQGSTTMISMLLGHSTSQQRQLRDAEGFTAIHLATAAARMDALRVLVAGGCSVDVRAGPAPAAPAGCVGWTPLHCAVRRGDLAAIEVLVGELGADPHARDACGRTPCDLAVAVASCGSRLGSTVSGVGSGIQNLDDTQWGPMDGVAAESDDGGGGGSSTGRARASASAVVEQGLTVVPLQGPSLGVGLEGGDGGGGCRLDEVQALAVLQTFIRLLHEPLRRRGALPPSVRAAFGEASSLRGGSSSGAVPAIDVAAAATAGFGGGRGQDAGKSLPGGIPVAAPPPPVLGARPPHLTVDSAAGGQLRRGTEEGSDPRVTPGHGGVIVGATDNCLGGGGDGGARGGVRGPVEGVLGAVAAAMPPPVASQPPNGGKHVGLGGGYPRQQPVSPFAAANRASPAQGDRSEAPSVALAYAAQMLAGPAATPTRASPFGRPSAQRQSPFQAPAAANAAAKAASLPTAGAGGATATDRTAAATQTAAAVPLTTDVGAIPAAAAVPTAARPSPFVTATRPSPFAAAARPSPLSQPPQPPQPQPPVAPSAPPPQPDPASAASAPPPPAALLAAECGAGAVAAVPALAEAAVPLDALPAPNQWVTPFSTAAAPPPAPPSDAAAVCIVSAINSPCGYSALNRAILLQRHVLAEALLATLPSEGYPGGVLVLTGPGPGRGRGAAAMVAYQPFHAASVGAGVGMGIDVGVVLWASQSKNLSPSPSQLQQQHLPPATSSAEAPDAGPKAAIARPDTRQLSAAAAVLPSGQALSGRPQTPPRPHAQPTPKHLQLRQPSSGTPPDALILNPQPPLGPSQLSGSRDSAYRLPPLSPLCGPGGVAPSLSSGVPVGPALIPGLLMWNETQEEFRTQPPNQASRAWLHWPGEPDPATGWLLAELVVVEAGTPGGHVWLGLGPPPEALSGGASSNTSSGSQAGAATAGTAAAGGAAAPGMSHAASGTALASLGRAALAPAGSAMSPVTHSGRVAAGPPNGASGAAAAAAAAAAACPVINHPSTHVVCIRDGQAFRGGALTPDLGGGARLEARSGDTVALFWNRRGRNAAFTLNGKYCGRFTGLPEREQLTPVLGVQCGAFVFRWRCGATAGNSNATGRDRSTANIDGMMIREQMLQEDPEMPWLCKPSMTSLHFAAWCGNMRVLPQLIRVKGFSPDEPDADGWTPLHFAALAGQTDLVRMLLSYKCHPDGKSKGSSTPAMLAAKYGRTADHVIIVPLLADAGADLHVRDIRGRTLLMLAARAGNLAMVQLLLDHGIDPSATDSLDREAQQYAGQHGAIFRLLRSAQAAQRAEERKAKQRQQQPAAAANAGPAARTGGADNAGAPEDDAEAADDDCDDADADAAGNGRGCGRELDVQYLPLLAEQWRVGAGQLVRGRLIEQGAFGAVFEGTWCGARVAIKQVVKRGASAGGAGESRIPASSLEREVAILSALPPHERIARMLGSVDLAGEGTCLVMAFYPHTLQGVMQSERLRRSWLTPVRRAAIARQLAEGLAFLHGLPGSRVIHRDLKPNNVLLEAAPSLGVKICDFGLSRILAGNDVQSSSAAGHAFWMAPELLRALPYDEKVDVYSYGVILYQLAYWIDDQLYGGLNKAQVDFQVVHGILRLQDRLPSGVDLSVHELVRDCLDETPRARPTMAQVLERLAGVRELQQPGHTGQQGAGQQAAAAAVAATGTAAVGEGQQAHQ